MDGISERSFDYLRGWTVGGAAPTDFDAKAPYIDNGTGLISPERYYSRDYMEREWERVWTKTWLIAGVQTDLREPGDFLTFQVGRESILVVMGGDSKVRAFYNVCAHRGMKLVHTDFGSVNDSFVCPYHRWAFHLDGGLARVTDRETFRTETIAHTPSLTSVKCEVAAGLIFINMDPNASPLMEQVGEFVRHVDVYEIDKMVAIRHTRTEIAANWKTGLDGFIEPYHFEAIHPQALPMIDDYHIQQDLYPNGVSRMIIKQFYPSYRLQDRQQLSETLRMSMQAAGLAPDSFEGTSEEVRDAVQKAKRAHAAKLGRDYSKFTDSQVTDSVTYSIFPNAGLGCHPEAVIMARFLPHATDPCRMYWDHITLYRPVQNADGSYAIPGFMDVKPGTELSGDVRPEIVRFAEGDKLEMGLLFEQDAELLPEQQVGVQSRGFKGAILGEQELRVRHYHKELDRYMAPDNSEVR